MNASGNNIDHAGAAPGPRAGGRVFREENGTVFRPKEEIRSNKEFCDCEFAWHFHEGDAHGVSIRKTLPAFWEVPEHQYPHLPLTAENATAIPNKLILGTYIVRFER